MSSAAKARILIVDDEKLLRWAVRRKCEEWGYEVSEAGDCAEAMAGFASSPDLALLDVNLPDGSGVEVLARAVKAGFAGAVIMITADPRLDDVKSALRQGAFDYLSKPVNFDELGITIANALQNIRLRQEVESFRDHASRQFEGLELIGESPATRRLDEFVRRIAASEANTVLLQGESGTGKDLIAQLIHQGSARASRPFVPVNCSAIPDTLVEAELFGHEKGAFTDAKAAKKGLFEVANGGTIYLDEIGELPLMLQSKLLRTLENQSIRRVGGLRDIIVDVRVIAASNRNLEQAQRNGEFRQDLFYRLGVIPVFIPPLRSRREDIPALAKFFIHQFNRRFAKRIEGLSPEAEAAMLAYDWPGNVRELKNTMQRAMILEDGPRIGTTFLQFYSANELPTSASAFPEAGAVSVAGAEAAVWHQLPSGRSIPALHIPAGGTSWDEIEKSLVTSALHQARGNQSQAARLLDISRDTLRYKVKRFGLDSGA